ncbi:MAG: IclR family transcriptional regulator [Chloroflexi bacterium]|nr:IclR family transcriptional regulator [Chloroflexota bacterium]
MRDNSTHLLKRVDAILQAIGLEGRIGAAELAKRVGLPRSTLYRLLAALEAIGYVKHSPDGPEYQLSIRLFELGSRMVGSLQWRAEARPILAELARSTGESAHLAVLDGDDAVYVDFAGGPHVIGLLSRVGTRSPLHCTAVGKILLAYAPAERRRELIARIRFKRYTDTTICTAAELEAELESVRRQGFATVDGEYDSYLRAVGAPVMDHFGSVIAAISVAGPSMRLSLTDLQRLAPEVCRAGAEISSRLGYYGSCVSSAVG